ncbi:MAG: nicotinate-nucleotide adenylyltransferase [Thainema sp.]
MLHIALFGTSADPPHRGHQMVLRWLANRFDLVAVWASDNPFKTHQTPLADRKTMLRLLIAELNEQTSGKIGLYPELSHPRAIATVEQAKAHWPEAEFSFVIGSDLLPQLPRWHRIEDLVHQVKFLIIPRSGYPIHDHDRNRLEQMGAQLQIEDIVGPDISSTRYREAGTEENVTAPIQDYIQQNQLYACQDTSNKRTSVR